MSDWNSNQYLKFKNQRTAPAQDLANRVKRRNPKKILDVGCGPGNSSSILRKIFPLSDITGVDNSENMIQKAKKNCPDIKFQLCDVSSEIVGNFTDDAVDGLQGGPSVLTKEKYDLVFSNACLQWIPNHKALIPKLFELLKDNGTLAVQIPMNEKEPLYEIADSIVKESKWGFNYEEIPANKTLSPEEYFDILSDVSKTFDVWETTYYHDMESIEAMVEWIKGTRLRPYLDLLNKETAKKLEKEIKNRAEKVYKKKKNGEIIFKFRRFFFTAVK